MKRFYKKLKHTTDKFTKKWKFIHDKNTKLKKTEDTFIKSQVKYMTYKLLQQKIIKTHGRNYTQRLQKSYTTLIIYDVLRISA